MRRKELQKITALGVFLAFALILSYVEALIPAAPGLPGVKLGLANLAAVLLLYLYGPKEAFLVNVLRILLAGFLFGNLYSISYSLAGGITSFAAMYLFWKYAKGSVLGVSAAGGVFHNVGQLAAAVLVTQTKAVAWYFPPLLFSGLVTGCCIGLVSGLVLKRTARYWKRNREGRT